MKTYIERLHERSLSKISKSDIMWIGISAQQNKKDRGFEPLDSRTPSGKFIESIEEDLSKNSLKTHS